MGTYQFVMTVGFSFLIKKGSVKGSDNSKYTIQSQYSSVKEQIIIFII